MQTKTKIGLVCAVAVIIGGLVILVQAPVGQTVVSPLPTPVVTPAPKPTPVPVPTPTVKSFTLAQVATHASAQSCWSAVGGHVYDLTQWINQHPGGQQAILSMCGRDATQAFNDQHGGQRRPERELVSLLIGDLK